MEAKLSTIRTTQTIECQPFRTVCGRLRIPTTRQIISFPFRIQTAEVSDTATLTSTPISSFTYVLDNVGNRTRITDGSGKVTALSYDPVYRVTGTTVASKA